MKTIRQILPLLLVGALARDALADRRNPLAGQPAIRRMREMRKLRFEVTPQFLVSTNQDYKHAFGPGANLQFHITDWIGIGLAGAYLFNANTPLEDKVVAALPDGDYRYPGPQPTKRVHNEHVLAMDGMAAVYASLTPWHGKFALFSSAFANYDFYVNLGGGFVHYNQNCCTTTGPVPVPGGIPDPNLQDPRLFAGFKGAGMVGVGAHIFFAEWVGLQLELTDYFAVSNPSGLDTNGDRILDTKDETIQNHIFFGLGISFILPPKAKISD